MRARRIQCRNKVSAKLGTQNSDDGGWSVIMDNKIGIGFVILVKALVHVMLLPFVYTGMGQLHYFVAIILFSNILLK